MSVGAQSKPVVVTRAESSDGPLSTELRNLGLAVLWWPAVTVTPVATEALDEALAQLQSFDWIVFASRHAVAAVIERVSAAPEGVRIAAVGQATAEVLRQRGWPVDLVPDDSNAEGLVAAFAADPSRIESGGPHPGRINKGRINSGRMSRSGQDRAARVLYPASSRALPTISAGLTQLGAEVVQVEAYRTEAGSSLNVDECRSWIERGAIGAVTFASPSAVVELEHALGEADFNRLLTTAAAVAIGPTTARVLTARGHIPVLADSATLHGLALTTFRLLNTRH